jgi:glutathionylspermidine synthase
MELSHFKWDVQVGDWTSLAPFPLFISPSTWRELARLTEQLAAETLGMEAELVGRPDLYPRIALPRRLAPLLAAGLPTPSAARILRFDFHYTTEGWRISEVNSDVPGGFTEATNFARLMASHVPRARVLPDPAGAFVDAIAKNIDHGESVALTCAPGHMEDHQVVAYLAERLREKQFDACVTSLQSLRWPQGHAHIETASSSRAIGAVVRFYQVEWLAQMPKDAPWTYLFARGKTPVANPGASAVTESKRLPLVWEQLRATQPTWRKLLPETRDPREAPWMNDDGWLVKAAYSNTGDTVSIRDAMSRDAWARVARSVRSRPALWAAQRRFTVAPLVENDESYLPCIGVYSVDGAAAGAYARLTRGPVVDSHARDAALLLSEEP